MATSLISLGRTSGAHVKGDGTVSPQVARFYAAADAAAGKASVHLARASLDLALCFMTEAGKVNVSAAHRYGVTHTVDGDPTVTEAGEPILDEEGNPLVPLVRVQRRQFARYVDAGTALVAAGYTAREVPTDAEVAVVRASLGDAYAAHERQAKGRSARPDDGSKAAGGATNGQGVPVPTVPPGPRSTFEQMIDQIRVWERGIARDHMKLTDAQRETLLNAITDLGTAMLAQHERTSEVDMGLRKNREAARSAA